MAKTNGDKDRIQNSLSYEKVVAQKVVKDNGVKHHTEFIALRRGKEIGVLKPVRGLADKDNLVLECFRR